MDVRLAVEAVLYEFVRNLFCCAFGMSIREFVEGNYLHIKSDQYLIKS